MSINFNSLQSINLFLSQENKNADLLIVSKNQSLEDIETLLSQGYNKFGENRVQEAKLKFNKQIRSKYKNLELHLIGPLQSNKVSIAVQLFDVIQTIDRKKIIDFIAFEKAKGTIRTNQFYIQVNIGDEKQKFGVAFECIGGLYEYAQNKKLNITGLMCIPPNDLNPEKYFKKLFLIREKLNKKLKLSMGMSSDYRIAIEHNSNLIRVGSKIFS